MNAEVPMRAAAGALAAIAILALTPIVSANGRFPAAGQILFHPADPDTIVVRATFGLLVTRDHGGEWRWICESVLELREFEDPSVVVPADGSLVAGMFAGLMRGTNGGCEWSFPDMQLQDTVVIDTLLDPSNPAALWAVTSSGIGPNGVFRSSDHGVSWMPIGPRFDGILFETIEVAPSDSMRIYLSGSAAGLDTPEPVLYRSIDGGGGFEPFPVVAELDGGNVYLSAVDPLDPDRVYARVDGERLDRLLVSDDGGESWIETLAMPQMFGFARSPDGSTLWTSGPTGLWRSEDRGARFEQVAMLNGGCLASREGELWICADNITDGFALGVSRDDGETIEPVLRFAEIERVIACPPESPVSMRCPAELPALRERLLGATRRDGGITDGGIGDAGGGPSDGGTTPPAGGCSCRTTGSPSRVSLLATLVAVAIVLTWARRRPRVAGARPRPHHGVMPYPDHRRRPEEGGDCGTCDEDLVVPASPSRPGDAPVKAPSTGDSVTGEEPKAPLPARE
jgi:MYXO-CTERM domain-containing protein